MGIASSGNSKRAGGSLSLAVAALIWALSACGCASPPGVMFDPANGDVAWPPPPEVPRIRYVGAIHGEADLHPGRSGLDRLGAAIFGSKPTTAFVGPLGVCTDNGHRVFIADSNAQVIHVLDLETREYQRWAPTDPAERLILPVAVAYDGEGRLLVSDSAAGEIAVFDATGRRTGTIGKSLLDRPCGLAVDRESKRIFVADAALHQVVVFSEDGAEQARIGRRGSEPGEFNYPTNVALDRAGRLLVSDSLNFRVQVFSPNLEFVRQIGKKGDLPGYFAQPKGVAVDPDGHIYVVDANFEAVQLFDSEGSLLMSFGREGQGPGEFWLPAGIWIDVNGRIWIADSYNRRVQVFDYLPEGKQP